MSETREHVRIEQREEPQLVEEERARIGRRREIEVEAGRGLVERTAVRGADDLLELGGRRHAVRAQQHGKFIGFGGLLERCERCRRERRLRHDQRRDVSRRREKEVAPGLGGAVRKQGRDGQADHSAGLVHFAKRVPAAHGEQAVRVEPAKKALPGLDRVKTVLREREGAGARRRPGIDEAHLDDVEEARRARKPAACLVHFELHAIQCRDRGVVGKAALQEIDDDRVDLDARHIPYAEEALRQDIPAAAHADDGAGLQVRNGIGEVAHVVAQELQAREVPVEAVDAGAGTAVDRQPSLLDRRERKARRRPPHRRWAFVAFDRR